MILGEPVYKYPSKYVRDEYNPVPEWTLSRKGVSDDRFILYTILFSDR